MTHKFEQRSSAFEGDRVAIMWCTVCNESVARFDTDEHNLNMELMLEDTMTPAVLWWQVHHIKEKKSEGD